LAPVDNISPGRRDYVWFVDTLTAGGNELNGIDGVSQNDVWAVSIPGDFTQTIYHFDGTKWRCDSINRPLSPFAVYAISSNNVWCPDGDGAIWNYNGSAWSRNVKVVINGYSYVSFNDITGTSSKLVSVGSYSSGGTFYYPLIYRYDGSQWSRLQVATDNSVQLYRIRSFPSDGKYLVLGSRDQQNLQELDTSKIYTFDGQVLKEIYAAPEGRHGYGFFTPVPTGMLISRGTEISISDGSTERKLVDVASNEFWNAFEARSEKDILLAMLDGIGHFNGSDIQYLYRFSTGRVHIHGLKLFEKSAFVIAFDFDTNLNYIFRGYLQ
jgi:hypothetical protein